MRRTLMIRCDGEFTQIIVDINENQRKWFEEKLKDEKSIKVTGVDKYE